MIRKLMLLLTVVVVTVVSGASASSISGFKFNDSNGNGTWDLIEHGLPNWTIILTTPDGSKITNTTNASGFYIFSNLPAGNYTLEEVLKPGWVRTFPKEPIIKINLSEGEDMNETGFGNMQISQAASNISAPTIPVSNISISNISASNISTFNISGFKINGDTGKGIQGWNITLSNKTMQTSTLTDMNGSYKFTGLLNGTYNVTEETRPDFTPASSTSQNITIVDKDITNINFTNTPVSQTPAPPSQPSTPTPATGSISGFKVNDLNGNGIWDAGENGLSGWNIRLTGIVPETAGINKEITTDDQGFYKFENLPAGKYLVEETVKGDFVPTSSPVKTIILAQGEDSMNNNFMNKPASSIVNIESQREIENKKDTDDHGNVKDNKDKGDQGNIEDNKDTDNHGNVKDKKDLSHKDKGKNHKNKGNKD